MRCVVCSAAKSMAKPPGLPRGEVVWQLSMGDACLPCDLAQAQVLHSAQIHHSPQRSGDRFAAFAVIHLFRHGPPRSWFSYS
ncbi:hypothetical protein SCALM49S_02402 [Streptomyces californicus]